LTVGLIMAKPRKRIGDQLIEDGIITPDELKIALIEQKASGQLLGKVLVDLGFVTDDLIRDQLGQSTGQESIDLKTLVPDPEALQLIDQEMARRLRVFPTNYDTTNNQLTVAMQDTADIVTIDRIAAKLGTDIGIHTVLAGDTDLETAIDRVYGFELSIDGILHEMEGGSIDTTNIQLDIDEYSHPIVRLVDALLSDAVKKGASDIHFEPERGFLRIRYRIDGVLQKIRSLHKNYWSAMVVRLKVMAGMNIAEMRAPQDGHISLSISGHSIDFRASAQPTLYGENIVLRILDRKKGIVPLPKLDLTDDDRTQLELMMARPEGIILVTGPTGSGKTTTLYSMLNHLNSESVNIMTLEDPVEYPMVQIRQSSINVAAKMDFATGIRSLMRQDPDIILVGEIRDSDTASMAFRAAMTGHQVFSTLHTNSAAAVFPRLFDIGVTANVMVGNIIGVVAQRLLRKLCIYCKEQYQPDELECRLLGFSSDADSTEIYRAAGCERCSQKGYWGRTAIIEIIRMDSDVDAVIATGAATRDIEKIAREKGFKLLADDGIRKVLQGTTSLEEVSRVIDLTSRLH